MVRNVSSAPSNRPRHRNPTDPSSLQAEADASGASSTAAPNGPSVRIIRWHNGSSSAQHRLILRILPYDFGERRDPWEAGEAAAGGVARGRKRSNNARPLTFDDCSEKADCGPERHSRRIGGGTANWPQRSL